MTTWQKLNFKVSFTFHISSDFPDKMVKVSTRRKEQLLELPGLTLDFDAQTVSMGNNSYVKGTMD